ncbi:MAG: hypothetical protein LBT09_09825 [Planctomycetaceae bacterium]|nr:hypothetical protein [Planctomycetaceae bacterium]
MKKEMENSMRKASFLTKLLEAEVSAKLEVTARVKIGKTGGGGQTI